MATCDCGADVWCKKWQECKPCYFRRYHNERRLGQTRKRQPSEVRRTCPACANVFVTKKTVQRFCSRACVASNAGRASWANCDRDDRVNGMRGRRSPFRKCGCGHSVPRYEGPYRAKCDECIGIKCQSPGCGEEVPRNRKWCVSHRLERKRRAPKDNKAKKCADDGCDRPTRARGLCSMHWKRVRVTEVQSKPVPFDGDRMRRHYERRTWQKCGEKVTISGLRARDGDACGICGGLIDFTLSGRLPMGRSVDHILPRSKGGAHTWDNCQLAHLRCNLSKGAKVLSDCSSAA